MDYIYPIYTEKHECRDCYKCVRACPVKAIRVKDGSAVVDHQRCIFCGRCVEVCPAKAKKIRNDIASAKQLLTGRRSVYVSLAPSFSAEFAGYEQQLFKALLRLGFAGISETALGAQLVSQRIDTLLTQRSNNSNPAISTACPSVVEMVRKYYPDLVEELTPVHSPLGAHSALLRKLYGQDIGVVFIGPCIAKKLEADRHAGIPDVSLTFAELRQWFAGEGIDLKKEVSENLTPAEYTDPSQQWFSITAIQDNEVPEPKLVPYEAGRTVGYAVESGMLTTLVNHGDLLEEGATASGTQSVLQALETIRTRTCSEPLPGFFEFLSCPGGCVNGPGCSSASSEVSRKLSNNRYTKKRLDRLEAGNPSGSPDLEELDISCSFQAADDIWQVGLGASDIARALTALGKGRERDRLNCGGCGYNSCEDFARAYLEGMAEAEMCVTNMRKQAQSKVDVLLRTLPMGVVIVDSSFSIMDCNAQFLKMFSSVSYDADEQELKKIAGLGVDAFVDIKSYLGRQFTSPDAIERITLHVGERIVKATFFTVDPKRVCGALFHDVTEIAHRRDAVVRKAEDVIKKNLESVQQIASLLGENAADTEIMLSSMKDLFDQTSISSRSEHGR
jgi:iron only hydrogenase large subunit-like protein